MATVMTAGLLSGCGTKDGTGGEGVEGETTGGMDGIVTLKVAAMAFNDQSLVEEVEAAANELLRDKGIAMDITFINIGSWQQQTNLLLTGGNDSVDICSCEIKK